MDNNKPRIPRIGRRSLEFQEGLQPRRPAVKSLFFATTDDFELGDRISVVQEIPEHSQSEPIGAEPAPEPAQPALEPDDAG